jgi:hypothetical protein
VVAEELELAHHQPWRRQVRRARRVVSLQAERARSGTTLKGVQCSFTLASEASLAYIGPARREIVAAAYTRRYAQYAHRNCRLWEQFLTTGGMNLSAERLVLVTACTLATSWITSVAYTQTSSVAVGVSFDANANISVSIGHTSADSAGPIVNSGPVYRAAPPPDGQPVLDQCLFVKGYSPSIWESLVGKVPSVTGDEDGGIDRSAVELPMVSPWCGLGVGVLMFVPADQLQGGSAALHSSEFQGLYLADPRRRSVPIRQSAAVCEISVDMLC